MILNPEVEGIVAMLIYAAVLGFALVIVSKIILAVSTFSGRPSPNVDPNSEAPNDFRMFNWGRLLKFYRQYGFTRELLAAFLFNTGVALFILPFLVILFVFWKNGESLAARGQQVRELAAEAPIRTMTPNTKTIGGVKQAAQYISTKDSAVLVGEAFLVSIYGKSVLSQRPFDVRSSGDHWILSGKLNCENGVALCTGGTARIEFSKVDGRIVSVIHGK